MYLDAESIALATVTIEDTVRLPGGMR